MKFGLTRAQYQLIIKDVVLPLQSLGASLWCYGSRARGDQQEYSDLDIMVEAPTDLSQAISAIHETLQNSNFPYKVDLVQLCDFADSYKDSYEADKIPFTLSPHS